MINPTHLIKKLPNGFNHKIPYINRHGKVVWLTHRERGWLGSGVKDKNGVEIFEGDIVKFESGVCGIVRFDNAQFYVDISGQETPFTLNRLCTPFVEVVGHIATEEKNEQPK